MTRSNYPKVLAVIIIHEVGLAYFPVVIVFVQTLVGQVLFL